MRNSALFFRFACVLLTLPAWTQVHAEVECSSEVFYTWTKSSAEAEQPEGAMGQGDSSAPPQETAENLPAAAGAKGAPGDTAAGAKSGKLQTVRFFIAQRRGTDEATAKDALQLEVQRQKTRAAERCKRAHESTGECLTTKLSIKSSTLNSLSFSARAQAEKALLEECQVQQGRCVAVDAAPVTCRDLSASGPAVEATGAKGKTPAAAAKPDAKAKDAQSKAAPKKK